MFIDSVLTIRETSFEPPCQTNYSSLRTLKKERSFAPTIVHSSKYFEVAFCDEAHLRCQPSTVLGSRRPWNISSSWVPHQLLLPPPLLPLCEIKVKRVKREHKEICNK